VGIPPEHFNLLFRKFGRLYHPATIDRPGSGLGLFIVKRLVESHGGRVWLTSHEGQGSKFSFTMPLARQLPLLD
jgi:signal transduction histidine kinase